MTKNDHSSSETKQRKGEKPSESDVRAGVSVIIPVFNAREWLADCLDSVLTQDHEDLQIICVNDGSTDDSLQILENYVRKDRRLTVISQENHGQGYARNRALEKATKKYVLFLDSDDMLAKGIISKLTEKAEAYSTDMLSFRVKTIYEQGAPERQFNSYLKDYPGLYNGREFFKALYSDNEETSISCDTLYSLDFLQRRCIQFPEGIKYEDIFWKFACYLNAGRCGFLPEAGYIYRIRSHSTMGMPLTIKNLRGHYLTANLMMKACAENKEKLKDYPEFHRYALRIKQTGALNYRNSPELFLAQAEDDFDLMMLDDYAAFCLPETLSKYEESVRAVYNSASYRLGNAFIAPLHIVKSFFTKK